MHLSIQNKKQNSAYDSILASLIFHQNTPNCDYRSACMEMCKCFLVGMEMSFLGPNGNIWESFYVLL